jgi:hypothetical protein
MTVVVRTVPSVPVRTSTETWNLIVGLLTAPDQQARASLEAITNTAAMLIAEEYTRDAPIIIIPAIGPRVRVYTSHGIAAVDDNEDVAPLASWPLAEPGWRVSLPCGIDDIDDVRSVLDQHQGIDVRDTTDGITVDASESNSSNIGTMSINYGEMERP